MKEDSAAWSSAVDVSICIAENVIRTLFYVPNLRTPPEQLIIVISAAPLINRYYH